MQQQSRDFCRSTCSAVGCCTDRLVKCLGAVGGRLTKERTALLHVSCTLGAHFTPEQIQRTLAARGCHMAMTTIYRNLPAIERAGIIRRTTFREEDRNRAATYEHVWGRPHHDHLLCQGCGKKIEFTYDALEVLQDEVARKHGFRLAYHHLELVGVCPECASHSDASSAGGTAK